MWLFGIKPKTKELPIPSICSRLIQTPLPYETMKRVPPPLLKMTLPTKKEPIVTKKVDNTHDNTWNWTYPILLQEDYIVDTKIIDMPKEETIFGSGDFGGAGASGSWESNNDNSSNNDLYSSSSNDNSYDSGSSDCGSSDCSGSSD